MNANPRSLDFSLSSFGGYSDENESLGCGFVCDGRGNLYAHVYGESGRVSDVQLVSESESLEYDEL